MRTQTVAAMSVLLMAGALASCGGGEESPGDAAKCGGSGAGAEPDLPFSRSEADTVVPVVLKDYEFSGLPSQVKGPKVVFSATVEGGSCHELEILDASGDAIAEIESFPAGEDKQLGLELEPGTYTAQCLVEEGAKTHAELGMKAALEVT